MSNAHNCVIITLDYPPERGGVARYLGNLVRASQGRIKAVYVPEEHETTGPGEVKATRFFWPLWPRWAPSISFFRNLGKNNDVVAFISQVLPLGTAAWIASFVSGAKYSILLHGLDLRLALASTKKRWLVGRILHRAEAVFVNSAFVAREVERSFSSIKPIVLLPGVESQVFPVREDARTQLRIPEDRFQLLAVTRLVPRKGIDQLLAALAFLPPSVHLTVIGSGNDERRLLTLADPYGDRVRFYPQLEDVERNAWYAAADAFVLPTRDEGIDVEGFGIVFLEAALAGLPAVAGKSGGVTEAVIHEETGLLVDPLDPKAIAAAIHRLMDDRSFAMKLGTQGRVRAERDFRWEDRVKLLAETLHL
jgi:phosphatidylinositol alpha-1,6-mannosyltransferase